MTCYYFSIGGYIKINKLKKKKKEDSLGIQQQMGILKLLESAKLKSGQFETIEIERESL
jgi:hypothetical protein